MNSGKYELSLVVVKNKLFVISKVEDYCEVFDNICKKFITIKTTRQYFHITTACSIGNKIYVFQENYSDLVCYDTDTNEWLSEPCEVTLNYRDVSSVKVPFLYLNNKVSA